MDFMEWLETDYLKKCECQDGPSHWIRLTTRKIAIEFSTGVGWTGRLAPKSSPEFDAFKGAGVFDVRVKTPLNTLPGHQPPRGGAASTRIPIA